jgi:hypothetical protein
MLSPAVALVRLACRARIFSVMVMPTEYLT